MRGHPLDVLGFQFQQAGQYDWPQNRFMGELGIADTVRGISNNKHAILTQVRNVPIMVHARPTGPRVRVQVETELPSTMSGGLAWLPNKWKKMTGVGGQ